MRRRASDLWPPALALLALVASWAVSVRLLDVSERIVPSPSLVARSTWADRQNLWPAVATTAREAVLGMLLAVVVAVLLAVLLDVSPHLRRALYPLLVASQTLPIVALAPLVLIWFGFGERPKIVLVALFTFFAVTVGLVQGMAATDPDVMRLARTIGAGRWRVLLRVRLPGGLPGLFTGLKVSVTYAVVSATVAEFVGAEQGLGVYMTVARNAFRTDLVFGAVIVTALLTLVLFGVVVILERVAMPWRPPPRRRR
jgi:ABC-type nitrate/sulfonate/bicarbonate transport system permease component